MSEAPRLTKAWTGWLFDGPSGVTIQKAETESQQLAEDPYNYSEGEGGLERPPWDLQRLANLLDGNSLHARCVKQKATDIVGRGIELRQADDDLQGSDEEQDRWGDFIKGVEEDDRGDGSFKERLTWGWQDYESTGWAVWEVGRRPTGEIDGLWHVPAHTLRAHRDGRRFAQKRADKLTWFKRFGLEGDVESKRGGWSDTPLDVSVRGNEVIVIRNYTPRSTYYGGPDHIPALAAMAGWSAQAAFNVRFFDNQAVPSYAVIVEGADMSPELEEDIKAHFQRIKGDPSRTIVIPVPGVPGAGEFAQPKVRFERLSVEVKEASFRLYKQDNALEICIAHGTPPYRIGWPIMGSLGGSTAEEMTAIYNDSIVQPRQETVEQRLNRSLLGDKGLAITTWMLKANELDVRNEMADIDKAKAFYEMGVSTPAQNAAFFGRERTDPAGQEYIAVPLAPQAGTADIGVVDQQVAMRYIEEVAELTELRKTVAKMVAPDLAAAA